MEYLRDLKVRAAVSIAGVLATSWIYQASAEIQPGQLLIKSVQGRAVYSTDQKVWRPLQPGTILAPGTVLRTDSGATADLVLQDSGTVLRMIPNTELGMAKLDSEVAGEQMVTETSLELKSGGIIGSQRKLSKPSRFDIHTTGGVATIRGTEYLVKSDGAVSCFRGQVEVHYGNGSGNAQVPAGCQFNPTTCQVGNYPPNCYADISRDMDCVRNNMKDCPPPRNVCYPKDDCHMSPTKPPDHDHDHDHDHDGDQGHGDDGHGHDGGGNNGGYGGGNGGGNNGNGHGGSNGYGNNW